MIQDTYFWQKVWYFIQEIILFIETIASYGFQL